MHLQVVLTQAVRRFGGVNVPPGRGQRQGPRGVHTMYMPGRACEQGPGRFGHVNVGGAGGLGGPAGRVQSVTAMADSSRRMNGMRTLTSVISTMLRSGSGTGHRGHRAGVLSAVGGGWRAMARTPDNHDCASVSCVSVSSDSRPCGRRCLAVWPLESGRVASGLSPRGVASFVHAARAPMVPYGG